MVSKMWLFMFALAVVTTVKPLTRKHSWQKTKTTPSVGESNATLLDKRQHSQNNLTIAAMLEERDALEKTVAKLDAQLKEHAELAAMIEERDALQEAIGKVEASPLRSASQAANYICDATDGVHNLDCRENFDTQAACEASSGTAHRKWNCAWVEQAPYVQGQCDCSCHGGEGGGYEWRELTSTLGNGFNSHGGVGKVCCCGAVDTSLEHPWATEGSDAPCANGGEVSQCSSDADCFTPVLGMCVLSYGTYDPIIVHKDFWNQGGGSLTVGGGAYKECCAATPAPPPPPPPYVQGQCDCACHTGEGGGYVWRELTSTLGNGFNSYGGVGKVCCCGAVDTSLAHPWATEGSDAPCANGGEVSQCSNDADCFTPVLGMCVLSYGTFNPIIVHRDFWTRGGGSLAVGGGAYKECCA